MTSMNFVFRPSIKGDKYKGSLSLRLIHNRNVKTVTLRNCRLYPNEWDQKKQSVIYPQAQSERIGYIEKVEQTLDNEKILLETYLHALQKHGRYSLSDLLKFYRLRKDQSKLLGYAESLSFDMERRGQMRTARAYRTVARGIVSFNKGEDIPLGQINACLIKDFETFLKTKGNLPNTISYYMRNLRAIYNKAVAEKRISGNRRENPFTGIYTGVTKTMKRALSLDELQKMHALDFSSALQKAKYNTREYIRHKSMAKALQYFCFCVYARGMCFIDLAYLKKDNLQGGFIRYVRKKTGRQIEVRITPDMQRIIDGFAPEVCDSGYLFPIIRETPAAGGKRRDARLQYEAALKSQNLHLKELARLSGIHKPVSTHWARHSWATIGKQENVPLRVISECLGHTSEKTTLIYLGLLDNSLLDAANEVVASAIARVQTISPPVFTV